MHIDHFTDRNDDVQATLQLRRNGRADSQSCCLGVVDEGRGLSIACISNDEDLAASGGEEHVRVPW